MKIGYRQGQQRRSELGQTGLWIVTKSSKRKSLAQSVTEKHWLR